MEGSQGPPQASGVREPKPQPVCPGRAFGTVAPAEAPVPVRTHRQGRALVMAITSPDRREPISLTPVDQRCLAALSLEAYRTLSCRQMGDVFFTSQSACQRRLEELRSLGLVRRLFLPDVVDLSRSEAVYTLSPRGAVALGQQVRSERPFLTRSSGRTQLFLKHAVRINDFRIALEKAVAANRLSLPYWLSDWQLRPFSLKRPGTWPEPKLTFYPDAYFAIDRPSRREYFFLEMDLGTMPLRAIRNKLLAFIAFHRAGQHQLLFLIDSFRVLLVTVGQRRMERMMDLLRDIGRCPNMFMFSALPRDFGERVPSPSIITEPVWHRCNESEPFPLL